ncbi:MAG: effector binding domain-containing protein [Bacillota bacterium]|nr:effector binding domain-containing protein [Bacillota bacterium]
MLTTNALKTIENVIDYIEANLQEKISLDSIADNSGLSKYHLHKIFKAITNKKMMDYVRNRKLTCSLNELMNTDLKIIDIAYEYNFEYEQSYIRSFLNAFKVSPDKFRREKPSVGVTDKINTNYLIPIGELGVTIEPVIKIKPRFPVIGIKHQIYFQDNLDFHIANTVGNDFFYNHSPEIQNAKHPDVYLGLVKYIPGVTDYKYYIPCLETCNLENIPDGMTGLTVPSKKYAVFKYIGFHHPRETTIESLKKIYSYIFEVWLCNSEYTFADDYHFERIDAGIAKEDYCEIELYIPVKVKKQFIKDVV